jgi:hypothetical protein
MRRVNKTRAYIHRAQQEYGYEGKECWSDVTHDFRLVRVVAHLDAREAQRAGNGDSDHWTAEAMGPDMFSVYVIRI